VVTSGTLRGSSSDSGVRLVERPFAGRVLLVDDMHEDAELLAVLLEPLGASVAVAGSTEEALAILDKEVVDLVVTDLNMPGASGLDLVRELRARRDVPAVIFMTGSQSAGDKVAAFELGAVAYLQKPIDTSYLIGLAREILRSRCAERTSDAATRSPRAASGSASRG
jgi:CheY-like chemotaxis protein